MAKRNSLEIYPGQRTKEKRKLFGRFVASAIEAMYKEKFFALFGDKCFKCGQAETYRPGTVGVKLLCIDHHVPMALGGHLVPGNLVSLCRVCNGRKLDLAPEVFYTPEELGRLIPLLEQQHALFDFRFDHGAWSEDRYGYLVSLGFDPVLVHSLLHDENHRHFVGLPDSALKFTIGLSDDLMDLLRSKD